jgi:hypothetical protein
VDTNITAVKNAKNVQMTYATNANANTVAMKIKEIVDYFYGLDPAHLSYPHKVGKIYGKKNLKIPHAKLHRKNKRKK